jgi:hypothetical protein
MRPPVDFCSRSGPTTYFSRHETGMLSIKHYRAFLSCFSIVSITLSMNSTLSSEDSHHHWPTLTVDQTTNESSSEEDDQYRKIEARWRQDNYSVRELRVPRMRTNAFWLWRIVGPGGRLEQWFRSPMSHRLTRRTTPAYVGRLTVIANADWGMVLSYHGHHRLLVAPVAGAFDALRIPGLDAQRKPQVTWVKWQKRRRSSTDHSPSTYRHDVCILEDIRLPRGYEKFNHIWQAKAYNQYLVVVPREFAREMQPICIWRAGSPHSYVVSQLSVYGSLADLRDGWLVWTDISHAGTYRLYACYLDGWMRDPDQHTPEDYIQSVECQQRSRIVLINGSAQCARVLRLWHERNTPGALCWCTTDFVVASDASIQAHAHGRGLLNVARRDTQARQQRRSSSTSSNTIQDIFTAPLHQPKYDKGIGTARLMLLFSSIVVWNVDHDRVLLYTIPEWHKYGWIAMLDVSRYKEDAQDPSHHILIWQARMPIISVSCIVSEQLVLVQQTPNKLVHLHMSDGHQVGEVEHVNWTLNTNQLCTRHHTILANYGIACATRGYNETILVDLKHGNILARPSRKVNRQLHDHVDEDEVTESTETSPVTTPDTEEMAFNWALQADHIQTFKNGKPIFRQNRKRQKKELMMHRQKRAHRDAPWCALTHLCLAQAPVEICSTVNVNASTVSLPQLVSNQVTESESSPPSSDEDTRMKRRHTIFHTLPKRRASLGNASNRRASVRPIISRRSTFNSIESLTKVSGQLIAKLHKKKYTPRYYMLDATIDGSNMSTI